MLPLVKRPLPVSSHMTRFTLSSRTAVVAAIAVLLLAGAALAQDQRGGNFLDNLFNRGEQTQSRQPAPGGRSAQSDPGDLSVRLDRMESALRQLTGTIEQLQYRNQQLESQLKRMQDDTEYRFQQMGSRGGAAPAPRMAPADQGNAPMAPPPARRSDVFDPTQNPNAPGAPRTLGKEAVIATPEPGGPPIGAPGGRSAGAPLDLSTMANTDSPPPQRALPPSTVASAGSMPVPASQAAPPSPPPQVRNVVPATPNNQQLATLPPSASPQDEYDMTYGYVLHKDYSLAEQSFRD